MSKSNNFMDQSQKNQKIAEYKSKLDELQAKAEANQATMNAELEESKSKLNSILSDWTESAEDSWGKFESEAEATWEAVQQKFSELRDS